MTPLRVGASMVLLGLAGTSCGRTELTDVSGPAAQRDGGACLRAGTEAATAELLARWNAAVEAGAETIDFHWRQVDAFPHPTYRRGSADAYAQFVDVLLRFWAADGTLDFVACNELFERTWRTEGQRTVQLRPLTLELSTFSLVDPQRRAALATTCSALAC